MQASVSLPPSLNAHIIPSAAIHQDETIAEFVVGHVDAHDVVSGSGFAAILEIPSAAIRLTLAHTEAAFADLKARWPRAHFDEAPGKIEAWVAAAFAQAGETRLHLIGAPFQIKVWEALMTIPSGHVSTYSDIAGAIGNPRAVRAVGTAVGRNPVSWLIPCHRAIRKSGGLGGYHWGLPVKRAMLAWEAARAEAEGAA